MITVKVYKQGREILVAACDKDQLGRTLREGEIKLTVDRDFYEGDDGDEAMLVNRLESSTMANLVGETACAIAIKHKFITEECVLRIQGVPHAQMVRW
ncbi:MAG: DUF424 family protein [Methanomassiliicoccales archaeon]|nr:MAG: DUF424 family protein [Methanomassiliicoccales archaeon]